MENEFKIELNDVIYELFMELGLSLNEENYVIYQKNNQPLLYEGRYIRFSYEERFLIDSGKEIWFDPINNISLIKNLYNQYIVDLYYNEKIRFNSTREVRDRESIKRKIFISFTDEANKEQGRIETIFYNNLCLAYMQVILRNCLDISKFDQQ